ncbi:MAG: hypothetical protein HQ546_11085 [Planctomycetes bacterium]|nr:hypothetical protein [Planctomycetota bacterium]
MKKSMILAALPLAGLAAGCAVLALGCASVRQLDAPQFLEQAEQIKEIHSAKSTGLIGVCGGRVYLERWHAPFLFESGITVYWTRLSDLPEGLSSDLKAGKNPWENQD